MKSIYIKTLCVIAAVTFGALLYAAEKAGPIGFSVPAGELLLPTEMTLPLSDLENEAEVHVFLIDSTESMGQAKGDTTRLGYIKNELKSAVNSLSTNVTVSIIYFASSDKCKHSGTPKADMGSVAFLSKFSWWAYRGGIDNGTLNIEDVAYVWAGPYTRALPSFAPGADGTRDRFESFVDSMKPGGMSTLAAGLEAALNVKGVSAIYLATDGPPAVLTDGREWKVNSISPNASEWKTSPYYPQGEIPEGGIDGYVKKLAEEKGLKDVPLHAAYFPMTDAPWGVKLLEELARLSGGSVSEIK